MPQLYATIGPKCCTQTIFESMLQEGLNGIRLNLSHTSLHLSTEVIHDYAEACRNTGGPENIIIDLHGPEQRVGILDSPFSLKAGDNLIIQHESTPNSLPVLPLSPSILEAVQINDRLLIQDGSISLQVTGRGQESEGIAPSFICRVLRGGTVSSRVSVKIEGKEIYGPVLTDEDMDNLKLAKDLRITGIMQPFVRSGSDICRVRRALSDFGITNTKIYAKIESLAGYDQLDSIIRECDVIVIARGDLGQAVPLWELPALQKNIAERCRASHMPFMVVTQMLQSMKAAPVPTRAEVSDIFNAVLDGASYLMVTGETAVGQYPDLVVRYLKKTSAEAEKYLESHGG